jgi:adenylate cyclase
MTTARDFSLMPAWLEKANGEHVPLTGNLSIGRTAGNQLVVEDQRVSRRHAIIHAQGGEFWLVDLGSRNGTSVRDRRVSQPVRLRDGDRITICSFVFTFHQPGAERALETFTQSAMHTRTEIVAVQCWLMVGDMAGSTALVQSLPPDQLAMIVGKWFQSCRALVEQSRGSVNKYLGDGFLAFWREPSTEPALLARTVSSLLQLQAQGSPEFRFVLHRGEVFFNSAIPSGEENLSGSAVTFAFRMEKLGASLKQRCLLSEPAASALEGLLETDSAGQHALAGFSGEFEFHTLRPAGFSGESH